MLEICEKKKDPEINEEWSGSIVLRTMSTVKEDFNPGYL